MNSFALQYPWYNKVISFLYILFFTVSFPSPSTSLFFVAALHIYRQLFAARNVSPKLHAFVGTHTQRANKTQTAQYLCTGCRTVLTGRQTAACCRRMFRASTHVTDRAGYFLDRNDLLKIFILLHESHMEIFQSSGNTMKLGLDT